MLSCLGGCFEPCNHHLPEVYPQNNQISVHLNEFLKDGYRLSAEAVEVRFPHVDGSRLIHQGSVGITDGYTKLIIMTGILVIAHSLEAQPTYLWECLKVGDPETLLDLTIGKCKKNPSHSQLISLNQNLNQFQNSAMGGMYCYGFFLNAERPDCQPKTCLSVSAAQELPREDLGRDDVARVLKTFRHVRCSYTHYGNPSFHHLHALRF